MDKDRNIKRYLYVFSVRFRIIIVLFIYTILLETSIFSQAKLAQTGFQFLSVTSDARAGAMGEAMTTIEISSSSLFFNPAGMARVRSFLEARFSQNQWIADINYNSFSFSIKPSQGRYGVFGFSLLSVNYGKIQGTMRWNNIPGYVDTDVFSPTALAIGAGYAKSLSDKFSVGGHIKSAYQSLGKSVVPKADTTLFSKKNIANAIAFDFGTIYLTGYKSLAFGMSIRNFSQEIKFESEGFQLPLTFRIGISMDMLDLILEESHFKSLVFTLDAVHPRSYPEYINFGMEYSLANMFKIRGGYLFNRDEQDFTAGIGFEKKIGKTFFAVDYASTPFGLLGNVQRLTFQFSR